MLRLLSRKKLPFVRLDEVGKRTRSAFGCRLDLWPDLEDFGDPTPIVEFVFLRLAEEVDANFVFLTELPEKTGPTDIQVLGQDAAMAAGHGGQPIFVWRAAAKFIGEMEHFDVFAGSTRLELPETVSQLGGEVLIEV